jgi:uncharacterized heparinase superfamily protein
MTSMERLGWYARRLHSMSAGELCWRGAHLVQEYIPRRGLDLAPDTRLLGSAGATWESALQDFRAAVDRPVLLDRSRARDIAAAHPDQVATLVAAAERILDGRVAYFGYPEASLGSPVDWNHDPVRTFDWPLVEASRIDHRTVPADPKWIWELNRLQHLPWLAQAWLFTGDDAFAETALCHLDTWLDQNPVGRGIAWRGAFEAGIRGVSVAVALQGLRDFDGLTRARFERIVRMLAVSAERCWRNRSRFSSANNHLVGELAGLATVALLSPELAPSPRWERRAVRALEAEAARQILPDGAGAEQAVSYQVFTVELLMVVAALLEARGHGAPAPLLAAINRSADYLAGLVGDIDPDPRYGDDDEGFALRLGPEPKRTVRDHLGSVAALTGNALARRVGNETLTANWLSAMPARSRDTAAARAAAPRTSFVASSGGLVVLRSAGRRLTMDVGPLGYLAIAAHGQPDALAVTVSLDGHDVIGHPGAASYYGHPQWRAAHRSTRAHPTVTVDGESQSVPGGPFLWTRHAQVRVRAADPERGIVDAEHDGYMRLSRPVTHRRWVSAPAGDSAILVVDEITGEGDHEVRTSWPVHPDLDVRQQAQGHLLSRNGIPVLRILAAGLPEAIPDQIRGDAQSSLGWWSHRLESRLPSWLVGSVARGRAPLVIATVLCRCVDGEDSVSELGMARAGDDLVVSWQSGGAPRRTVIDRARSGAISHERPVSQP